MSNPMYSVTQFQIYPLELFILLIGFILGVMIGSLNDRKHDKDQESKSKSESQLVQTSYKISPIPDRQASSQSLLLSHSLTTGQSFQFKGVRSKLFKGHIYHHLPFSFVQSHQGQFNSFYCLKSSVTKFQKDGQWTKLYNSSVEVPKEGKFYFNIFVVKNEYFIKRQGGSQKAINVAVSRTDAIVGFFMTEQQSDTTKLSQNVKQICKRSQTQSNNIQGIVGYGFNGRIYNNGQLRTEQKIIKKNKQLSVLINRDEGFIAFELEGETIGLLVIPNNRVQMIPFVEMYAVGSSLLLTS